MAIFLAAAPVLRAQSLTPEDQYFDIYSLIVKGDRQVEKGRAEAAQTNYLEAARELKKFQEDFPLWNTKVVKYRLQYLETKLTTPIPIGPTNAPVKLKLKWQVGKRYEEQMDMTMGTDIDMPGQSQPMQQQMKMGEGIAISAVKEREGGGKELDLQITGISMNMAMGGKTLVSFDSKNQSGDNGTNPAAGMLQKLAGLHLKMLTDADGKVEKIEGMNEFLDSLSGGAGMDAWKGMFSEDSIKQMASLQGLPDHPVKVGDQWPVKTEISVPALGKLVTDMTFTFTGWEQRGDHKCAVLSFTGTLYAKPGDNGTDAGMISVDDGKTKGEVLFDVAQGMPVETSAIQNISMKVSTQGQSVSTKMSQDISMKLASVKDIAQQP